MQFTVQVEKPSNVTRKLMVRVPAAEVAARFNAGLKEVARTAKLKGFRPGMAPISVIKQIYGADVRHQVFHNLIDDSYQQALQREKIRAVGRPQIETPEHQTGAGEHDHTVAEDKDLTFTATVEVMPEIDVKSYKGLSLTQASTEVTAKDVDQAIAGLMDSQAELIACEEGHAARKGDYVDVAFSGGLVTEKGVEERPGMKGSRLLEIGSEQLIPGFEDQLIGLKKGGTKTFRIPFPADYFEKEMAGKESEFTVTINEVKAKKLPELNDDFAVTMGYENLADMKTKAQEHLVQERTQESERKLKSDLLQALIEKNSFDCPETLIAAQTRSLAQDVGQNLKQQGFTDEMIQQALSSELDNLKKRAENQVRASLILEAIAKKEGLSVTEEAKKEEIARMAASMKVEVDRVWEFYNSNPARMSDLEFRMNEDLAVKFLLENSKVKKEK